MDPAASLKALRHKAGLTQQQLAGKAGLDRSWVNQMERGNRRISESPRSKLAKALAERLEIGVTEIEVELGGGKSDLPEFRGLHQRLEELEAAFGAEQKSRQRGLRAVTRRLAELEAALAALTQQVAPQPHQRSRR